MTLCLHRVCKTFQRPGAERKVALRDISMDVTRGELLGVFGPSGAGKTTLLRVAAGQLAPDAGWVSYEGARLDRMVLSEQKRYRLREVACVWAAPVVQERLPVLDHVQLPLLLDHRDKHLARERAEESLFVCEAEGCQAMEMGELSDGERQRVELARALVCEPKLLLVDAPAAHLALREREAVMHLLYQLAHDAAVAVLATSSDVELLARADRLLYLRNDGTLIAPEAEPAMGQVLRFPSPGAGRAAADA